MKRYRMSRIAMQCVSLFLSHKIKIKQIIRKVLLKLLPFKIFDWVIALVYFWIAHHCLPTRKSELFIDYLYFLKTSIEIERPLRQLVSGTDLVKVFYRGIFQEDVAPRTLLKFSNFDSFMKSDLPDVCVFKPAHLSGCIFINSGKSSLGQDQFEQVRIWFSTNYYDDIGRGRNYRLLEPSVICEEIVANPDDVRDYKIFCYRGEIRMIQVDADRHGNHKRRLYTKDWQPLPFHYNKPLAGIERRPEGLDNALELARLCCRLLRFH